MEKGKDKMAERTGERLKSPGHIEVICGGMYAGKSEELIRRVRRAEIGRQKVQVFKPSLDDRRGIDTINSNDGSEKEATSVVSSVEIFFAVEEDTRVVAIDEAQFFDDALPDVCRELARGGKRVIVAGLDVNFKGRVFNQVMGTIIAEAEYVDKLHAICVVCGDEASLPQRIINGQPAGWNDPLVMVGGQQVYEARCRHCHELPDEPRPDFLGNK